jgi:hypothetical protein
VSKHSRRDFLLKAGYGVGGMSLIGGLGNGGIITNAFANPEVARYVSPLTPKAPHFPAKAKAVIWLHQEGAPSTLDLFDYKPQLEKLHGQAVPESFLKGIKTSTQGGVGKLFASNRSWKQHGDSGAWFSDLLPNLANHADDIAFIKSSVTIGATHDPEAQHGRADAGTAIARRMGPVCAGLCKFRPARIRRAVSRTAASRRRGELELRLPASGIPRHGVPSRQFAHRQPDAAERRERRRTAAQPGSAQTSQPTQCISLSG